MPHLGFEALNHFSIIKFGDPSRLTPFQQTLFKSLLHSIETTSPTFHTDLAACQTLKKSIKTYLRQLNIDKQLPLHFRIHVMTILQKRCATYFDTESTLLCLESYRIAIHLLPMHKVQHHVHILDLIIAMLKIAIFDMQLKRKNFQVSHHRILLCIDQILCLLFPISSYLSIYHPERLAELERCICWFEFLRGMNFYSKDLDTQAHIIDHLQLWFKDIEVSFYENGETLFVKPDNHYLVVHPHHPEKRIKLQTFKKDYNCEQDTILLDVASLLNEVSQHAKASPDNPAQQACQYIYDALREHEQHQALCLPNTQMTTLLALQALDALNFKQIFDQDSPPDFIEGVNQRWRVVSFSKIGVCLKRARNHATESNFKANTLIGLQWKETPDVDEYQYHIGFLRWQKRSREEEYIGIEFFNLEHQLVCATFHNESIVAMQEKEKDNIFWLPLKKVQEKEKIYLYHENGGAFYRIVRIHNQGRNFCRCEMKVLNT